MLVGRRPESGYFVQVVVFLLRGVVSRRTAVAEQTDRPGNPHTLFPGFRVFLSETGVRFDGHALRFVESDGPRLAAGRRCDQYQFSGEVRSRQRHFEGLESADRTADDGVSRCDAEVVGQQKMGVDHVAYRDEGKCAVVRLPGRGIDAQRTGRSVMRADDVRADDEITLRVEKPALFDRMRPPVGYVRVGCQRVADPDRVVPFERSERVVGDGQLGKLLSVFERERLVVFEVAYRHLSSGLVF